MFKTFIHAFASILLVWYVLILTGITQSTGQTFPGIHEEIPRLPVSKISSTVVDRMVRKGTIYHCYFDAAADRDEDHFPDGWVRYQGTGYPQYLDILQTNRRTPFGPGSLHVSIRRGGAAVFSPKIKVLPGMTYSGACYVLSQNLTNDRVLISLSLVNANGDILKTERSETVINTEGWIMLQSKKIVADHPDAYAVSIGLHVFPGERQDLFGEIEFASALIIEHDTITLTSNNQWSLFSDPDNIVVRGRIVAVDPDWSGAKLVLEDPFKQTLESHVLVVPSETSPQISSRSTRDSAFVSGNHSPNETTSEQRTTSSYMIPSVAVHDFEWSPSMITEPGLYKLTVSLPEIDFNLHDFNTESFNQAGLAFALIQPSEPPASGEFGWSLKEMPVEKYLMLRPLFANAGISRLKIPIWLEENTPPEILDKYITFCEWLNDRQIQSTAMLAVPPAGLLQKWISQRTPKTNESSVQTSKFSHVSEIFSMPSADWLPSIETNIFRFNMLIHEWQLGYDDDRSLDHHHDMTQLLALLQKNFDKNGFDLLMGFGWDWIYPFPLFPQQSLSKKAPGFLVLSNELPLATNDLEYYLDATRQTPIKRHILLQLLDHTKYTLTDRIRDLVEQMVIAKMYEIDGIFIASPFQNDIGMYHLTDDNCGEPGELFLPWRTTSQMLAGRQYIGKMITPQQSHNRIFRGTNDTCMVIWNDMPTRETLFLGEYTHIFDVWGKEIRTGALGIEQNIEVGPLPLFVTGINTDVTLIRQLFRIEQSEIPSLYGKKQPNKLYLTNTSENSLSAQLKIIPPQGILVEPKEIKLIVASGETAEHDFSLTLTPDSMSGEQILQFEVTSDLNNSPFFRIYQPVHIGGSDVSVKLSTLLNHNNEIEIHQAFLNNTETPVNFICTLYIPDRALQKMHVRDLLAAQNDYTYIIPNGSELLGKKIRVVAKEVGGQRVLRYQQTITP